VNARWKTLKMTKEWMGLVKVDVWKAVAMVDVFQVFWTASGPASPSFSSPWLLLLPARSLPSPSSPLLPLHVGVGVCVVDVGVVQVGLEGGQFEVGLVQVLVGYAGCVVLVVGVGVVEVLDWLE
jgi:hypothetical protein